MGEGVDMIIKKIRKKILEDVRVKMVLDPVYDCLRPKYEFGEASREYPLTTHMIMQTDMALSFYPSLIGLLMRPIFNVHIMVTYLRETMNKKRG